MSDDIEMFYLIDLDEDTITTFKSIDEAEKNINQQIDYGSSVDRSSMFLISSKSKDLKQLNIKVSFGD